MKKAFLALALLTSTSAFAQTAPKSAVAKAPAMRADHCTGAAAAKCDKDMANAKADLSTMPACCRAKMAAKAAEAKTASAEVKPSSKSM